MKKIILSAILLFALVSVKAQIFTIDKNNCNINFVNYGTTKTWYSYDLYEAVITYNPALDSKQFIISDNHRTNTFTITQIINFTTIPTIIDSFYSWKTQCIDFHK